MAKAAYKVKSLDTLVKQVNKLAPNRSKASDGWIGDKAHAARKSQHNPDADGSVDAVDITHDPAGGCDAQKLADAIVTSRDRRVQTLIHNGKILTPARGWTWRKYTGSNPHKTHLHIDVLDKYQDDASPWAIESAFSKTATKPPVKLTTQQVSSVMKKGSKGEFVEELQKNLNALGFGNLKIDGDFGDATEAAVKRFQSVNNLEVDGWAGPRTLEAIGKKIAERRLQPKVDEAQAKVEVARKIVEDAASSGKKVSTTEWLSGLVGAGGAISVVKEVSDNISEASQSIGGLITGLGPWVFLGLIIVGGAAYIFYDRRHKRIDAQAVKQVM